MGWGNDCSTAQRDYSFCQRQHLMQGATFHVPKLRFAVVLENLFDGHSGTANDQLVQINERPTQAVGEQAPHRRLSAPAITDQYNAHNSAHRGVVTSGGHEPADDIRGFIRIIRCCNPRHNTRQSSFDLLC